MDYRVYFVGDDGHFKHVEEIECDDDQAALARATELAKGQEVQVWCRERCVAILNGRSQEGLGVGGLLAFRADGVGFEPTMGHRPIGRL